MTYSSALMAIPRAAYDSIRRGFEEAGYDREMISAHPDNGGGIIHTLDMEGIAVFAEPGDPSDTCVNAGFLSDAVIDACKAAFDAGHKAAMTITVPAKMQDPTHNPDGSREEAWSAFTPAQSLIDAIQGA